MTDRLALRTLRLQGPDIVNYSYLLYSRDSKNCILIDPAWEEDKIVGAMARQNLDLSGILLTHSHNDHSNLAGSLAEKFNAPVYLSAQESADYDFALPAIERIKDNDIIEAGPMRILARMTPGHTTGSMCYSIGDYLFTGDTLFIEGCGVCKSEGSDPSQLYDSLKKLKDAATPETTVHPGHRFNRPPGLTMKHVLKHNIYMQESNREAFIAFHSRSAEKPGAYL